MRRNFGITLIIAAVCVITDLISKSYIAANIGKLAGYKLAFISISPVTNMGMAFSILSGHKLAVFLPAIALGICFAFSVLSSKYSVSMGFIIGGGLANYIQRITSGYVYDFIKLDIAYLDSIWRFPVFNLADIFIAIGGIILIARFIYKV